MNQHKLGRFCWHDLMTSDADRSQTFYESLFGWTLDQHAAPNGYRGWRKDNVGFGGIVPLPAEAASAFWAGYVTVEDCESAASRVEDLGGKVIMEPTSIPDIGMFAPAIDNLGADLVLFQPDKGSPLASLGSGGSHDVVIWNELISRDLRASVGFYRELCGWEYDQQTVETGGYVVAKRENVAVGGIFQTPELPESAGWVSYFVTGDIAATVDEIAKLGGTLAHPIQDVPGIGRTSWQQDPVGATFGLMEPLDGWLDTLTK